ncbi:DoxX family protein [Halobacteriales archaeon QS_1_68_17]|nr:MAG: DoxX family protein [Halobacteriales archaeon QS_1_68_17]
MGLRTRVAVLAVLPAVASGSASAHVDYVTDGPGAAVDAVDYAASVLAVPANALLFLGGGLAVVAVAAAYLRFRPAARDVAVFRETIADYRDLVPWMLRLSLGIPLVGAGFAGYLFSPVVAQPARILQVVLGFFLLFGLATRAVAAAGLVTYLVAAAADPRLLLAMEYVGGFLGILLVGGGRPSADDVLGTVATAPGTVYGRVDPVHRVSEWVADVLDPFRAYAPSVVRVGLGATFVYLGLVEKLANPGRALLVVEQYDLTALVPVDPGVWVLGAGLVEIAVGVALVAGLFTRATALVAFVILTTTLFGLPNDPVLPHVTLFGLSSAVLTMGAGPLSLDAVLAARTGTARQRGVPGR